MKALKAIGWLAVIVGVFWLAYTLVDEHYVGGIVSYEYMPDGTVVMRKTIDGHDYLYVGKMLTHSASCKKCNGDSRE